ncbi:class I SAM-dependent RNA methyltransferase [Ferrovibrio sp.]|uniref:class I SAM-dependent RNA methyltransferase n=1 Tax=Ferrovibrio sp. TaxID=1917215 RepID=UPI0035AF0B49
MRDCSGVITRLGGQGDGVFDLPDGTRAYVPYTLPGERVSARLGKPRGGGFAAQLVEIETVSPERIEAACQHFMACGGCSLQHWTEAPYRAWKRDRLVQALARRDFLDIQVDDLRVVPPGSRRRIDLNVRRIGKTVVIGYHEAGSHRLVDITECPVARPELLMPLPALRAALQPLLGEGKGIDLKLTAMENGLDLLLAGPLRLDGAARSALAMLAAEHNIRRLAWRGSQENAPPEILAQSEAPYLRFGTVRVTPAPGGFLQATAEAEAIMAEILLAELPAKGGAAVADLFSGCGAFGLRMAEAGHRVQAYDADKRAIAALTAAINAQGLAGRIRAEARDLERRPLLAGDFKGLDALLLDPPRAGARAQVQGIVQAQAKQRPGLILMAACDPNSFARDARLLVDGGYQLQKLVPIDQFLWSPHLELAAVFRLS